jgi:RNA polymerase sigma-70 factor, ECF subfamily
MKKINDVKEWNDETIARGIADGSIKAYREFTDRFGSLIYNHCLESAECEQEATDLLNEILIKMVIVIGRYDPAKAALSTWVIKITENFLISHYRRKKTDDTIVLIWPTYVFDLNPEFATDDGDYSDLDDEMISEEPEADPKIAALEKAMEGLSERDRKILQYRAEGMGYDEICEYLDIKMNTAMTAWSRATKRVRERMSEHDGRI